MLRHQESPPFKKKSFANEALYGVFLRWPEDGEDWVHPLDIGVARHLLPGNRIFRREQWNSDYYQYHYGKLSFRAKPKLWMLLEHEGFDIDDFVEVKSMMGKNWKVTAKIVDVFWDAYHREIEYSVEGYGRGIQRRFLAGDLMLVPNLKGTGKLPHWQPPLNSVAHEVNNANQQRNRRRL